MKSSKKRFYKTKLQLDNMLLNKLHNSNVYTPDQFTNKYLANYVTTTTDKRTNTIYCNQIAIYAPSVVKNYISKKDIAHMNNDDLMDMRNRCQQKWSNNSLESQK